MPRNYIQKTARGKINKIKMKSAAKEVENEKSIRAPAKDHGVDRMSLQQYIKSSLESGNCSYGYGNVTNKQRVFSVELEAKLAIHVKNLANIFLGLTNANFQKLAYEFVVVNNVSAPVIWTKNEEAGKFGLLCI